MGWSSGTYLYEKVIEILKKHIPDEAARKAVHKELIEAFMDQDWDTTSECLDQDPAYDAALKELRPDYFEEEDED